MKIKSLLLIVLPSLLLSACTWVKVSSEGAGVNTLTVAQAAGCTRLGQTHSKTLDKIAFVKRSQRKQKEELEKLAKDEAAKMGGNAIVADGAVEEGRQTFIIYKCS